MQTLVRAFLIALSLFAAGHAGAQTYPDRAIRIIVGFTPGSATDISGRMFAQKLTEASERAGDGREYSRRGRQRRSRARRAIHTRRLHAYIGARTAR